MIATVVNVFCLLFAVILALIAMANVFNTVTNSLILRRREFAVMKSVGLSNRQFRAMVAEDASPGASAASCPTCCCRCSCPSFLAGDLRLLTGLPFTLPWNFTWPGRRHDRGRRAVRRWPTACTAAAPNNVVQGPPRRRCVGGCCDIKQRRVRGALRPHPPGNALVSASRGAEMM